MNARTTRCSCARGRPCSRTSGPLRRQCFGRGRDRVRACTTHQPASHCAKVIASTRWSYRPSSGSETVAVWASASLTKSMLQRSARGARPGQRQAGNRHVILHPRSPRDRESPSSQHHPSTLWFTTSTVTFSCKPGHWMPRAGSR
jgi:hypothetical protein